MYCWLLESGHISSKISITKIKMSIKSDDNNYGDERMATFKRTPSVRWKERLLKMKLQRELLAEKEKQKNMNIIQKKEERSKIVLQQREEKLKLLKEKNERRRLLVKERIERKKKVEEEMRLSLQKKIQKKKDAKVADFKKSWFAFPLYMTRREPSFPPCEYNLEEVEDGNEVEIPEWMYESNISKQDAIQSAIEFRVMNKFFFCRAQKVDLRDLFKIVDPKLLKRSDSAIWEHSLRYSE